MRIKKVVTMFVMSVLIGYQLFAQNSIRIISPFDNDWKFHLGDVSKGEEINQNENDWQQVDLPHDWDISQKISRTAPMGGQGGFYPAGIGWYRKHFNVPADWTDKKVSIVFEGVYMDATVWINGMQAANQPYGYTTFTVDISKYIKQGTNTIAVKVDNSHQKNSRWYTGSGIYRHVLFQVTDAVHIDPNGLFIFTTSANSDNALVKAETIVKNETDKTVDAILKTTFIDSDGKQVSEKSSPVSIKPNSETRVSQVVIINHPNLWSPESPMRYKAVSSILVNEKLKDDIITKVGVRQLVWTNKGLTINGKVYKLNGGCIHHDNGILGAAAFDRAEERKIALLQQGGFNSIRTAHNPPSPELLNACDSLGMLVMDELLDCWTKGKNKFDYSLFINDWWQKDLDAFVKRDRNHPCVIMWSTGNEIPGSMDPKVGGEWCDKLADRFRLNDPTRPVTQGLLGLPKNAQDSIVILKQRKALDIVGCNYNMGALIKDEQNFPQRIVVGTESSPGDGPAVSMRRNIMNNDFVVGDHVWAAQDYLGEVGVGRWFYRNDTTQPTNPPRADRPGKNFVMHGNDRLYPWHGANPGDLDILGNRKPTSHFRNILWDKGEKIYMAVEQPKYLNGDTINVVGWGIYPVYLNWNYPADRIGKIYQVEVYAKADKVELYLNDKLIGEKPSQDAQGFKTIFDVSYTPGILKAVSYNKGIKADEFIIKTVGEPYSIRLSPDKTTINNDGQDLSFVQVEVVDKEGNLQPNANMNIHFEINGSGIIQALGNANLKSEDVYMGNDCKVYNGKALIVIKGNRHKTASSIIVKASGEGLKKVETIIKVK